MLSRKNINAIVVNFKESLIAQGIPVEHLWLFGSYAKGTPHPYSDIDIAVFSSRFVENPFENTQYLQHSKRVPQMQVHLFTMLDYTENPFVHEIAETAIHF